MPLIKRRQDPATLIWEYLDGDISPTRAHTLSTLLAQRSQVRAQLVESAVMEGMLFEYFRKEQATRAEQDLAAAQDAEEAQMPKRRRRLGRSSAA